MSQLDELLKFVDLTHKFQQIRRRLLATGEERAENDAEHSYQLAMTAWYLIVKDKLPLDVNLAMQYALVHDLVEVHAGDTYTFETDPAIRDSKQQREHDAALRLKAEFTEFPDLYERIQGYETRVDEESKFVFALDKVLPTFNIYLDGGKTWRRDNITEQMIWDVKQAKVQLSPPVQSYFEQIFEAIKNNRDTLFHEEI